MSKKILAKSCVYVCYILIVNGVIRGDELIETDVELSIVDEGGLIVKLLLLVVVEALVDDDDDVDDVLFDIEVSIVLLLLLKRTGSVGIGNVFTLLFVLIVKLFVVVVV